MGRFTLVKGVLADHDVLFRGGIDFVGSIMLCTYATRIR